MRTYGKRKCPVCREMVSAAGAAWVSHMRKHVREGKAVEGIDPWTGEREFEAPTRNCESCRAKCRSRGHPMTIKCFRFVGA